MKLLLLAALVAVALAQPHGQDQHEWEMYKVKYAKNYNSLDEEELRKGIFMTNLKFIRNHNARYAKGEETYNMAVNKFADMTPKEFSAKMNGFKAGPVSSNAEVFDAPEDMELPSTVDWRTKGAVTGVKDQGSCGACWAFSTTGSLEGQHYLSTKKLVSLSEQNLVDCSTKNDGCEGGLMDSAFEYIKSNKGIDTESSYPYTGRDGSCSFKSKNVGATLSSYVDIPTGNEKKLQQAVTKVGPISVAIDATDNFQFYSSGVFSDSTCSNDRSYLNHGVLAVGYGVSGGKQYWLVKNSWGSDWGLSGYIMMSKNKKNQCGIATCASYPKV